MKQVKFYARGNFDSIGKQVQALNNYIEENTDNVELVSTYVDGGGNSKDRTAIKELLNDIEFGDVIIATKPDRISRNIEELSNIEKQIKEKGATIKYLCYKDDEFEKFQHSLVLSMYELFNKNDKGENNNE